MKTKINELITKLSDLVEQLEITNEQLAQAVDDYNCLNDIDWHILSIYANADDDLQRCLKRIREAVTDYIIFANKPF